MIVKRSAKIKTMFKEEIALEAIAFPVGVAVKKSGTDMQTTPTIIKIEASVLSKFPFVMVFLILSII